MSIPPRYSKLERSPYFKADIESDHPFRLKYAPVVPRHSCDIRVVRCTCRRVVTSADAVVYKCACGKLWETEKIVNDMRAENEKLKAEIAALKSKLDENEFEDAKSTATVEV